MSDQLDSKTDGELNELFAVEVAGYDPGDTLHCGSCGETAGAHHMGGQEHTFEPSAPQFCTDANAVLPWLENWRVGHAVDLRIFPDGGWGISIREKETPTAKWFAARAPTFARAVCIALLRAAQAKAK